MMDNIEKKFEDLWNDSNVQNIMNKVSNRYNRKIDLDDLESIKMDVLWKCIDKHDPSKSKFTSYLYQQLTYAMKNKLKKKSNEFNCDSIEKQDDKYQSKLKVIDAVSGLDQEAINILSQRFYDNMTMAEIGKLNGYSRETARRRLKSAIKYCQESCL
jgi:RNA polymerase sigma factor (sigma-70 family)